MKQNHSPLPWKCDVRVGCLAIYPENTNPEVSHCLDGASKWAIYFKQGHIFAGSWELNPEDIANAQFIVQACNAHGVLLQACKDTLYYLRQCEKDFSLLPSEKTMKGILSEAIAKAEAKGGDV